MAGQAVYLAIGSNRGVVGRLDGGQLAYAVLGRQPVPFHRGTQRLVIHDLERAADCLLGQVEEPHPDQHYF